MDLLLELLLVLLLLLLLYVFYHIHTRVPSCNARNKMKLQERTTCMKHLCGTFEINRFERHFMTGRLERSANMKHLYGTIPRG